MQKNKYTQKVYYFKKSLVIHEGNTKQISTMTVTLDLINILTSETGEYQ